MSSAIVTIFDPWRARPIFHVTDPTEHDTFLPRDDGSTVITKRWQARCGKPISVWGWTRRADGRSVDGSYWDRRSNTVQLRRDHAESFARVCTRCAASEERTA